MRTTSLLTAATALAAALLPAPAGAHTTGTARAGHCLAATAAAITASGTPILPGAGLLQAARVVGTHWAHANAAGGVRSVTVPAATADPGTPLSPGAMAARVAGYRIGIDGSGPPGADIGTDIGADDRVAARPHAEAARSLPDWQPGLAAHVPTRVADQAEPRIAGVCDATSGQAAPAGDETAQ